MDYRIRQFITQYVDISHKSLALSEQQVVMANCSDGVFLYVGFTASRVGALSRTAQYYDSRASQSFNSVSSDGTLLAALFQLLH